jgi:hypothetical protein
MSLRVKALHIFERRLHGGESISDHVPFVGGKGLDQVYLSMSDRDKSAAKSRRVTQGVLAPIPRNGVTRDRSRLHEKQVSCGRSWGNWE